MARQNKNVKNYIKVFAPATVANVGCGFDIFGFALDNPGDVVEIELSATGGVVIEQITGDDGLLPVHADKNTASRAIQYMLAELNLPYGVRMKLHKKMPIGSGLGSSAASSVAGVFGLNQLLQEPVPKLKLLEYAAEGERITSGGSLHLDNVTACLYGGFVLVRTKSPPDIVELPVPADLFCAIVHPRIEIKTSESRKMLKNVIPLATAIDQWANVAGLVSSLYTNDLALFGRSLQDKVAEPVRSILIPCYAQMKKAALESGAIGFGISGSGPSVFALSETRQAAETIGHNLLYILNENDIANDIYISPINKNGPRIVKIS